MKINQNSEQIIFFDGICNLCNKSVDFIIRKDKKRLFKFASIQSGLLAKYLDSEDELPDSIVLLKDGNIYIKADAAIEIGKDLGGIYNFAIILKILPKAARNKIYDVVAKNRYNWFGKRNSCRVPAADDAERFLD